MRSRRSSILLLTAGWVLLCPLVSADEIRFEPAVFVRPDIIEDPEPERFSVCHSHGCAEVVTTGLGSRQWQEIARLLTPPAKDAKSERIRIARAIARFEQFVGVLTNTAHDAPENGWVTQGYSMDCIDESTNTTTYLRLLAGADLLLWHRVEAPASRGWFIYGWPHSSAVIRDLSTDQLWAVDSWFFENGKLPVIVPLAEWRRGWRPQDGKISFDSQRQTTCRRA